MPSSPSTRLRLELQALGENLNTWGDVSTWITHTARDPWAALRVAYPDDAVTEMHELYGSRVPA